ncbi:MAG: hypothetical protein R3C14_54940 [Caldilineaceae bacterium]
MTVRLSLLLVPWCALLCLLTLAGCQRAPAPESSSGLNYAWRTTIPVDTRVYTITGTVAADVASLVRQTAPAQAQSYSAEGVSYGTFYGPQLNGKGMARLIVTNSDSALAPAGSTVILKLDDTKGILLQSGDHITLKCRAQFEAIAAVMNRQAFDPTAGSWELDYCRLATPVVGMVGGASESDEVHAQL